MQQKYGGEFTKMAYTMAADNGTLAVIGAGKVGKTTLADSLVAAAAAAPRVINYSGTNLEVMTSFLNNWMGGSVMDAAVQAGVLQEQDIADILEDFWDDCNFSIEGTVGRALAVKASKEGLSAIHPFLWRLVTQAYAEKSDDVDEDLTNTVLNATVRKGRFRYIDARGRQVETDGLAFEGLDHSVIFTEGAENLEAISFVRELQDHPMIVEATQTWTVARSMGFGYTGVERGDRTGIARIESRMQNFANTAVSIGRDPSTMYAGAAEDMPISMYFRLGTPLAHPEAQYRVVGWDNYSFLIHQPTGIIEAVGADASLHANEAMETDVALLLRGLSPMRDSDRASERQRERLTSTFTGEILDMNVMTGAAFKAVMDFMNTLDAFTMHKLLVENDLYRYILAYNPQVRFYIHTLAEWYRTSFGIEKGTLLARTEVKNAHGYAVTLFNTSLENPYTEIKFSTPSGPLVANAPGSLMEHVLGGQMIFHTTHFSVLNLTALYKVKIASATHRGGLDSSLLNAMQLINDVSHDMGTFVLVEQREDFSSGGDEERIDDTSSTTSAIRDTLGANSRFVMYLMHDYSPNARSVWIRCKHYGDHLDDTYAYRGVELGHYPVERLAVQDEMKPYIN